MTCAGAEDGLSQSFKLSRNDVGGLELRAALVGGPALSDVPPISPLITMNH
jgi:hypothetical protein